MKTDYPILLTMNVGSHDEWLRLMIRSERNDDVDATVTVQRVIVQDAWEADRIVGQMARAKHVKQLPYGGAWRERWLGW